MFTGLVEGLGRLEQIVEENGGRRLTIAWPGLSGDEPLELGESVAVSGCCLTVGGRGRDLRGPGRPRDAGPNQPGKQDRPAIASISSGHSRWAPAWEDILSRAISTRPPSLRDRRQEGEWEFLAFDIEPAWTPLLVSKGSIAVDGVSLTLVDVWPDAFSVMLIPHTLAMTTLGITRPGDRVNIEVDILAKHVQKLWGNERVARSMMPIRQTQSYLRNLFDQHGISPQRRLGQNFLIDLNIHDLIVEAAEVGPERRDSGGRVGHGRLDLAHGRPRRGRGGRRRRSGDGEAHGRGGRRAAQCAGAQSRCPRQQEHARPEVLDNVRAGLAAGSGKQLKLVANLPYHVATPVIVNLLVHPELCPALMVVTIQRELAERMCAPAATSAYGAVSVVVQALADVSIVRSLPPTVFWPRPKVDSAVVAIRPDPAKRAAVGDVPGFTTSCAECSFTAASTSGTCWPVSGATAGPRPRSTPGSSSKASAASSVPSRSMSRSFWR